MDLLREFLVETDAIEAAEMPLLEIANGPEDGRQFVLKPEITTIGRSEESDVCIRHDNSISRHHARILCDGNGRFVLEDVGSTYGTLVNGGGIQGPTPINPEDVIHVGDTDLLLIVKT